MNDGLMEIADFKLVGLSAQRGIGTSRLRFSTEINLRPTPGREVELVALSGKVFASAGTQASLPLGPVVPETSWFAITREHPQREFLSVDVYLSGEQLEALERLRGGGGVAFQIDLRALVTGNPCPRPSLIQRSVW